MKLFTNMRRGKLRDQWQPFGLCRCQIPCWPHGKLRCIYRGADVSPSWV